MLELREARAEDASEYLAMVDDFVAAGEGYPWNDVETARADFTAFVADLDAEAAGIGLPDDCPRQSTYLLVDGPKVLGEFRFRPFIEAPFERFHGHIAYNVRPSARRRGHATHGLALLLNEARDLGLHGVMLTVDDPGNAASIRVITRNCGRLRESRADGESAAAYWISL